MGMQNPKARQSKAGHLGPGAHSRQGWPGHSTRDYLRFGISSECLLIRLLSKQHTIKIFLTFTIGADFLIWDQTDETGKFPDKPWNRFLQARDRTQTRLRLSPWGALPAPVPSLPDSPCPSHPGASSVRLGSFLSFFKKELHGLLSYFLNRLGYLRRSRGASQAESERTLELRKPSDGWMSFGGPWGKVQTQRRSYSNFLWELGLEPSESFLSSPSRPHDVSIKWV